MAGPLRYIKSAGNAGDGGLTKVFSSAAAFIFPVGVVNYTPASIGFSTAPTAYGSITVIPVNYAHPNVTAPGRSLTYFWRVKSSGFTLGSATVTHGYTYAQANVVTGAGITEDEYVAARFNTSTNTWTKGTTADVDEINNIIGEPGPGSFLENVSFIDGDYTAGDDTSYQIHLVHLRYIIAGSMELVQEAVCGVMSIPGRPIRFCSTQVLLQHRFRELVILLLSGQRTQYIWQQIIQYLIPM